MASFLKQLSKSFVRSAINQVGRDGGRVISNQLYNGKNYVPVANVGQQSGQIQQSFNSAQLLSDIPNNAIVSIKPFSSCKLFILGFISFVSFPLGSLCVFIYGLMKFCDTMMTVEWISKEPQYTEDRRYKSGVRCVGVVEIKHKEKVLATQDVIALNKRNGKLTMIIAAVTSAAIGLLILIS